MKIGAFPVGAAPSSGAESERFGREMARECVDRKLAVAGAPSVLPQDAAPLRATAAPGGARRLINLERRARFGGFTPFGS